MVQYRELVGLGFTGGCPQVQRLLKPRRDRRRWQEVALSAGDGRSGAPSHLWEDDQRIVPALVIFTAIRLKVGTVQVREWHGVTHRVTVLDDGFDFDSARFRSLSEIARKITGVRWSGPLYFGLKSFATWVRRPCCLWGKSAGRIIG